MDAGVEPGGLERQVHVGRPGCPPHLAVAPVAPVLALALGELLALEFAHGEQHMCMPPPVFVLVPGDVGDHPLADELALHVSAYQVHSSLARQLFGNGHVERAGRLRVPLPFGQFGLVPDGRAVVGPAGGARWREDLGRGHDAGPTPVIVDLARALVDEALAGTVGGAGDARLAFTSFHHLDVVVVQCHCARPVLWPRMRPCSVSGSLRAALTISSECISALSVCSRTRKGPSIGKHTDQEAALFRALTHPKESVDWPRVTQTDQEEALKGGPQRLPCPTYEQELVVAVVRDHDGRWFFKCRASCHRRDDGHPCRRLRFCARRAIARRHE